MNTFLLNTLADFLETVDKGQFDLDSWVHIPAHDVVYPAREQDYENALRNHKCGYSACAIGWATTLPEFKEAGLRYDVKLRKPYLTYGHTLNFDMCDDETTYALAHLFGISEDQVHWLFMPEHYEDEYDGLHVPPSAVVKRIRFLTNPDKVLTV